MTFRELLDSIAFDADDDSADYRARATTWLNLTRAYICDKAQWRSALDPVATFTTDAATTSGIYSLTGYESVSGDFLYDETSETVVRHDGLAALNAVDPDKQDTGPPDFWCDAGMDSNGVPQVYLWPVPDAAYVIRFAGYKSMSDITASDEDLSSDAYYGPLTKWAPTFKAGLRYYHDLNNNEDPNQIAVQLRVFERLIAARKARNDVAPTGTLSLHPIRTKGLYSATGRLDPSHYNNRG